MFTASCLALILILSLPVHAQVKRIKGGVSLGMGGAAFFDWSELNEQLKANHQSEFDEGVITMGGGGYFQYCRLIVGGSGFGFAGQSVTDGDYTTQIQGGFGMFNIGFLPFLSKTLRLYPLIGIGGGNVSLQREEEAAEGPFDEHYADPPSNTEFSVGSAVAEAALALDFLIVMGENEQGYGGLVIGLRGGYIFPLYTGSWRMQENTKLTGGPKVGLSGPYICLSLGFGGFSK